jgi:hypothetical protein
MFGLVIRPILRLSLLPGALLLGAAVPVAASAVTAPSLDTHRIARDRFGNDAPWYENRIPFFESADPRIDAVYYYRWSARSRRGRLYLDRVP